MHDWIDLELARQRREELLSEAHERQKARASVRRQSKELTTAARRLILFLRPERKGALTATEKPGIPIQVSCTD